MLFGEFTKPADFVGLTTRTFFSLIDENPEEPSVGLFSPLVIDFAGRTVRGTVKKVGEEDSASAEWVIDGTIDTATNQITGTVRSKNGAWTGTFIGRVFGPAAEIGLLISAENKGKRYVSELYGMISS